MNVWETLATMIMERKIKTYLLTAIEGNEWQLIVYMPNGYQQTYNFGYYEDLAEFLELLIEESSINRT